MEWEGGYSRLLNMRLQTGWVVGYQGGNVKMLARIFKMNKQKGPTVQHMELYSMLCASLDGKGF